MHEGLRRARDQGIAMLIVGVIAAWLGACGQLKRSSLYRHGPFNFSEYDFCDIIGVSAGFVLIATGLYRAVTVQRALRETMQTQDARFFARAGLARNIYELLLGIAAANGRVTDARRATIERLLMSELPERVLPQDLASWARRITAPRDPKEVAAVIAPLLNSFERTLVLEWCRMVALADGHMDDRDNEVLSRIAATLQQQTIPTLEQH
jgi:hypothetical protein